VVGDDRDQSVFAFLRFGGPGSKPLLVVCNFTPIPRLGYRIGVPAGNWSEVFNSDLEGLGGSGVGNSGILHAWDDPLHGQPASLELSLPPLATIFLKQE
jgi:1,4-alpha-glucan branching enzyme